jgi:4'-phosphopantetheinyl transferase
MTVDIELFYCLNNNNLIRFSESALMYLSQKEIERASKFIFPKDKNLYTISHAFLNRELSRRTNISFEDLVIATNQFDKPYICDNSFFFNLSHSNNSWSIGFCKEADIGIDIEWIKDNKNFTDIISHYFTVEEQKNVTEAPLPLYKFYEIWTRKEAILKAIGLGLNYPLDKVDVNNSLVYVELPFDKNVRVFLETFQPADVFMSVASFQPFIIKPLEITDINFESFFVD